MYAQELAAVAQDRPGYGTGRIALAALVLAWGAQAIVAQSLLLREALVLMFGSELAWGIVLFAWLLGVAVGAGTGGAVARRLARPDRALVLVLLTLGAATCLDVWAFREARDWLRVGPGELLPLPKMTLAALLLVCPAGALVGAAFPLAASVGQDTAEGRKQPRPYLSFGAIYALESAGSLIGGAAFSFWAVEHLNPLQTALICAGITLAASAGLLSLSGAPGPRGLLHRRASGAGVMALAAGALVVALLAGDSLHRKLIEGRWRSLAPGYELVAEAEARYQNLALGRLSEQYTLYCDGQVTLNFPDPYTLTPLAHFWLCQHPGPRQVLLIGSGAEGLLAEILKHPIEHVDYVQTDPRQLGLIEPYLPDADRRALADPRLAVHYVDARHYVKTQRSRFDLVIARLPEPTSAQRSRFYTDEFYAELRRAMTSRAVFCLTAFAAPAELPLVTRSYLASIRATLARHFPQITVSWGDPAHLLAATEPGLTTTDPAELARRYIERGVHSERFDPLVFEATDWLDPHKLNRRRAELDEIGNARINTDSWPALYLHRLELWEAATSGAGPGRGTTGVISRLRSARLRHVIAALAAAGAATLIACRLRRGRRGWAVGAVALSVGSTGLTTMALSIVWLYAFQNLYGYVYQRIGWIVALFMAGLVLGSLTANRLLRDAQCPAEPPRIWGLLMVIDGLLAGLALTAPLVLKALAAVPGSPSAFAWVECSISVMVILTGLLGGAAFPLSGELQRQLLGRIGPAAGSVVSADHLGACLGALLCGVILVPVFGTVTTAILLTGTKAGSVALLLIGRRVHVRLPGD